MAKQRLWRTRQDWSDPVDAPILKLKMERRTDSEVEDGPDPDPEDWSDPADGVDKVRDAIDQTSNLVAVKVESRACSTTCCPDCSPICRSACSARTCCAKLITRPRLTATAVLSSGRGRAGLLAPHCTALATPAAALEAAVSFGVGLCTKLKEDRAWSTSPCGH